MLRPGFSFFIYVARILVAKPVSTFAEYALSRRADRTQHCFARPTIDLQSRRFLVRPERRAGLHPGLAVEFVLVETDARQVTLHGFDIGGAQLGRSRPRRREWLRVQHAVAEVPDEQYVQVGKIIFLDDEVIFGGQTRRAIYALVLQQRRRLRLFG